MSKDIKKLDMKGRINVSTVIQKMKTDQLMVFCSKNSITIFKKEDFKKFSQQLSELGVDSLVIAGETQQLELDNQKRMSIGVRDYAPGLKRDSMLVGIHDETGEFEKYEIMPEEEYNEKLKKSEEALNKNGR